MSSHNYELRAPSDTDGGYVHRLVAACPPLDANSVYCNLLQCSHFSATSVGAYYGDELAGFMSGYLVPKTDGTASDTLFVWQVAVSADHRGQGLGSRMLQSLLHRDVCTNVHFIETTITEDNEASWALFRRTAKTLDAPLNSSVKFDRDTHFLGEHATEMLVKVGPFRLNA